MTSHQFSVSNHHLTIIEKASAADRPDISGFYICAFILNIIIMQNEPKFKTAEIPIIPFTQRTNKKDLQSPQQKNEPKRTQINSLLPAAHWLLPDIKIMTNEPNFRNNKTFITPFIIRLNVSCLKPVPHKNEPKRTQIKFIENHIIDNTMRCRNQTYLYGN